MLFRSAFDVDLPCYHGPLDLLLYLIRREEVDIFSIQLRSIAKQYLEFVELLSEFDLENICEYIDMMSQLIEFKADSVLPQIGSEEATEDSEEHAVPADGSAESGNLIERLIQYKRYRDLASVLDEQSRVWQLRYGRLKVPAPKRRSATNEISIAKIEVWDLVSAFGRILKARQPAPTQEIAYDDTPIQTYMHRIHGRLENGERVEIQEFFKPQMHKSGLIATFLAMLELTRYHGVVVVQDAADGPLWLERGSD